MCAPVSVATGGATGGCISICRIMPQILASLGIVSVLMWNFKNPLARWLHSKKAA